MPQARFWYSIVLILACVALMAAPGLSTFCNKNGLYFRQDCLSTLQNIHGCALEIITCFLSNRVHLIGAACCKAFNEVDDKCWPKVFPFFPPLLKNHCGTIMKINTPPSSTNQAECTTISTNNCAPAG